MTTNIINKFPGGDNDHHAEAFIDVLDDYGIRTGESMSRNKIHELGKIHRAVHLYLFDKSNHLLLQRRSYALDHYPGVLSISLTGHIDAGESSSEALYRELKEELNFNSNHMKIEFLFSFRQDVVISPRNIDRQFNDVYACWHDFSIQDVMFNPNEVCEVTLVPFSVFQSMVYDPTSDLSHVYKRACADVA
ncbi:NUDIX hydrolase [Cardinium endosymbiont of Tipula unca]|uniref:NUDIX hydrolase n=1 Tax=Cardinium endosymbiont of Tipula unca TaxID=3066216 RepID=UPI0030CC1335